MSQKPKPKIKIEPCEKPQKQTFGYKGDRFEINEFLGEGSQASVYSCTRRRTGVKHAAKKIDFGRLHLSQARGKVRKNLEREVLIMRNLHHKRLVNLIEAFWEGDVCFIVMDLARYGNLHDQLVPGSGLGDEELTIYVTRQLLDGLGYMHREGVVHRDLKPANILIHQKVFRREGYFTVKIADFGLSRVLNEPGGQNVKMSCVGTPAFAAPEVYSLAYDFKADFWSLGCVMYTMLCGEFPFDENKVGAHLHPPRPCDAWPKVTEKCRDVVIRLLKTDPRQRLDLHGCLRHPLFVEVEEPPDDDDQELEKPIPIAVKTTDAEYNGDGDGICCEGILAALRSMQNREGEKVNDHQRRRTREFSDNEDGDVGVISRIRGWRGSAVDSVELRYKNGERRSYGSEGGTDLLQWTLEKDEVLIAVTQERVGDGYLGNSIAFMTSKGRSLAIRGADCAAKRRFVAPTGTQVVGLMFEASKLMGVLLEETDEAKGLVRKIWGSQLDHAVGGLKFILRDGEVRGYGSEEGGGSQKNWDLQENERIMIVVQGWIDASLGYSISLFTSAGNIYSVRGISRSQSLRFMAPEGSQISGLEFAQGSLSHVTTCPRNGNMNEATRHKLSVFSRGGDSPRKNA